MIDMATALLEHRMTRSTVNIRLVGGSLRLRNHFDGSLRFSRTSIGAVRPLRRNWVNFRRSMGDVDRLLVVHLVNER